MIDLHVHTRISDGYLTIREIIKLAVEKGIGYLAITDHDTTKGLKDAVNIGQIFGITIVPGIEISAYDYKRNRRAHILGLYIEPGHSALEKLCRPLAEARHSASKEMVEKIIKAGYNITWDDIEKYAEGGTGVYKQHIMNALLDMGHCESIYCSLYKKLFSRGTDSAAQGIAYVPLEYVNVYDAINAVRNAGGVAIIAHPGQLDNYDSIEEWVEAGLEGIEAYHQSHSSEDVQRSLGLAEKYNLIVTGGSDFHGFYGEKPVELGCRELSDKCIWELENRARKRRGSQ